MPKMACLYYKRFEICLCVLCAVFVYSVVKFTTEDTKVAQKTQRKMSQSSPFLVWRKIFSLHVQHMNHYDLQHRIVNNVQEIRRRIERAACKSGRTESDVRLIAVSKYAHMGDGIVEALVAAGCGELGEARPQRLLEKAEHYLDLPIRWHLIGQLQRNKVRKILPVTELIHSLDSLRLAEAICRIAAEEHLPPIRCLLEVVISQDANKHGFKPEQVLDMLDTISQYKNIAISTALPKCAGLLNINYVLENSC